MSSDIRRDPDTLAEHARKIGDQETQHDVLHGEKLYVRAGRWVREVVDREIGG